MVIITCEEAVVPLPAQVWESEHDLPKSFKGDMFTCEADSEKRQTSKDPVRSCFLHVPRCFLIGERQECSSISGVGASRAHFMCSADSGFLFRGTLGPVWHKFVMSLGGLKKKKVLLTWMDT